MTLPDGCYIRYDKVKCELEMKGTMSSLISSQVPVYYSIVCLGLLRGIVRPSLQ